MPLLRRQPFQREKPPPDIHPEEEVFHCKLTNEIFRDYEKFFERIILCNSLVWSCSVTGRSGLTYQEAEESEEKALKQLASFPAYLQKPILYLVTRTQRTRLADLNDDIFGYCKDRYFIGEMVDVICGSARKSCKVLGVIPPSSSKPSSPAAAVNGDPLASGDIASTSSPDKKPSKKLGKPECYQYIVQEPGKAAPSTVKFKMISRKKGLYTRDKCKLFLKQSCDSVDGVWRVKTAKAKKLGLGSVKFEDIFMGPLPQFEHSEIKMKKTKKPESKEVSPVQATQKKQKEKSAEKEVKKSATPISPVLTVEEMRMLKEQERQQREKEREEKIQQKMREKEEFRKRLELEKEKRRQEKAQELEKKREERRVQYERWTAWSRVRDDLDCDDLKVMPEPIPVKCRIPVEDFGDAVMIVEFLNCFSSLFDLKSSFPKGFSLKTLEEALLETDAGGLMADLLLMMMTAIFSLQEEEEEEQAELQKDEKEQVEAGMDEKTHASDMTVNQLIDAATAMSLAPLLTHGTPLRKLPLDNFTLTEILRLHILASGAQGNLGNAKFRYQQRGGYMPVDDAGLDFKRRSPEIVSKLAVQNIYDLSPNYKLSLLKLLVDQFLTYAASRDLLEDNYDKLKQLRSDLKQLQWAEQRREREEQAIRYRMRLEEKQIERDILEKKRLLKVKQKEEQVRKEAAAKGIGEVGFMALTGTNIEVTEEEIKELEASLPTPEEREQRQKAEDDEEADKKAEFSAKERDALENLLTMQHGNAIYPLGRDRKYRRYWVFKSLPGLFVEDDEQFVSEEALKPCSQNPEGSSFDLNNPYAAPPKTKQQVNEPTQQPSVEGKEGSDKENDSMNASGLNSTALNDSSNTSQRQSLTGRGGSDTPNGTPSGKTGVQNGDSKQEDMIVISDEEDDKESMSKKRDVEVVDFIETPAITQLLRKEQPRWAFYHTVEDLDALIGCLNNRGYREKALKAALLEHKNVLLKSLEEAPLDLLCAEEEEKMEDGTFSLKTREWRRGRRNVTGTVKNDSAHEGLELNLRELILDLEERIHVGSLGYIRVKDRGLWRNAIENGSYDSQSDDPAFIKEQPKRTTSDDDVDMSVDEEESSNVTISQDMAKALVQIARGTELKYLKTPLGEEDKSKPNKKAEASSSKKEDPKKEEADSTPSAPTKTVLERWEESCLQSSSLAQVFLHLASLEKSVLWSKSLLHTRCRICRRKCDPDKLLLCDLCDRGHHIYCLKPPLKHIPSGDWFCPDCKPKEAKRSPVKKRRRAFSEHVSSDEEEEEDEEHSDEEAAADNEEGSSEEEDSSVCAKCSQGGKLVCCDNCPLFYHLGCAEPPLKKIPKGKWLCQICAFTDTKAGKIKMNLVKGNKKKNSPKTTPSSSKASSRRGSPRDSPLTVSDAGRKRKRPESPLVPDTDKSKLKRSAKSTSKLAAESKNEDQRPGYVSSSRGSSKVQQLKLLEDMVVGFMEEDDAWPFLRPVLKKDAPDYYEVIKKPMDFQTIKNRINKFQYTEPADLVSDVRLIFSNCIEYNKRTTPEFKAGASLSKLFEKRLKNLWETAETNGPSTKRARTK